MSHSSFEKAPIEIWQHILHEAISSDSHLAFETTCTSETYLAYRGFDKVQGYPTSMESYTRSEYTRRNIRLVCRAWKTFIDGAKRQDGWIQLRPSKSSSKSMLSILDFPLRVDITFREQPDDANPSIAGTIDFAVTWFRAWKHFRTIDRGFIRLVRLEILDISSSTFNRVFDSFCEASNDLRPLRFLGINIPINDMRILQAISDRFPWLTHLTLLTQFGLAGISISTSSVVQAYQTGIAFSSNRLEVLFLQPSLGYFDLDLWTLPRLHTFAVNPILDDYELKLYPFLRRHAKQIESLDLENCNLIDPTLGGLPPNMDLPFNFWEEFSRLKLLRLDLRHTVLLKPSKEGQALRWLVDTNPISGTSLMFFEQLASTWEEVWEEVWEEREQLNLLAKQLSENLCIDDLGEATSTVLRKMKENGVGVISNNGEPLL